MKIDDIVYVVAPQEYFLSLVYQAFDINDAYVRGIYSPVDPNALSLRSVIPKLI